MRAAPAIPALALLVLLAGCAEAAPVPTPTPTPTYDVTGDGVLRIGTAFSTSDPTAIARVAAVELAVRDVNAAGGYHGAPVELLHRNAGDDPAAVGAVLTGLADRGADVVIGGSTPQLATALADAADGLDLAVLVPDAVASVDDALAARVRQSDPAATDPAGAVEAYAAVVLAALAADLADDDGGAAITRTAPTLADGASACADYTACLDVIAHDTVPAYRTPAGTAVTVAVRQDGALDVG